MTSLTSLRRQSAGLAHLRVGGAASCFTRRLEQQCVDLPRVAVGGFLENYHVSADALETLKAGEGARRRSSA